MGRIIFCENCGSPLQPGSRLCDNCGTAVPQEIWQSHPRRNVQHENEVNRNGQIRNLQRGQSSRRNMQYENQANRNAQIRNPQREQGSRRNVQYGSQANRNAQIRNPQREQGGRRNVQYQNQPYPPTPRRDTRAAYQEQERRQRYRQERLESDWQQSWERTPERDEAAITPLQYVMIALTVIFLIALIGFGLYWTLGRSSDRSGTQNVGGQQGVMQTNSQTDAAQAGGSSQTDAAQAGSSTGQTEAADQGENTVQPDENTVQPEAGEAGENTSQPGEDTAQPEAGEADDDIIVILDSSRADTEPALPQA